MHDRPLLANHTDLRQLPSDEDLVRQIRAGQAVLEGVLREIDQHFITSYAIMTPADQAMMWPALA